MKDLKISDIVDLVTTELPAPEEKIERLFEWQFSREIEIAKWLLGAGASLAIAIAIAAFRQSPALSVTDIGWSSIGPTVLFFLGFYRLYMMKRLHRSYISALHILGRILRIKLFLVRYTGG